MSFLDASQIPNDHRVKIEVSDLSFSYGDKLVLEHINFNIYERAVTAVIGPSGCGKSSFIKAINRIAEVSSRVKVSGKLLIDGKDIYDPSCDVVDLRRRVGMVFQKPNPFPKSIYQNVIFGLSLQQRLTKKKADEAVEISLREAALWDEVKDSLHSPALSLSGGQQQRLCIARTLAVTPEVILMDEPCSALDPIATAKIEELILDLKERYTIVIVTHNMQQAARISHFSAFLSLNDRRVGHLVEFNETSAMFTKPGKKLTEDYITGRFG